jgi:hypothetical protein
MRRLLRYRPSPAVAIAFVALFVALSAGAFANLPGIGSVNSGDILNNTIRSRDIRNGTIQTKDFNRPNVDRRYVVRRYAVVDGRSTPPTIARGVGAVSVNRPGTGQYQVRFNRNVRNCAYIASLGDVDATGVEGPGEISTVGDNASVTGVFIQTFNSAGTSANHNFHLEVVC